MADASGERMEARLSGHAGSPPSSTRTVRCGVSTAANISLLLFVGNELEGGPANLYLRTAGDEAKCTPLLGPQSPTCFESQGGRFTGTGSWLGVDYSLELTLSQTAAAWFWHVQLVNRAARARLLDLTYAQDLALAPYGAVRMNEYYVSQYVDHTPLVAPGTGRRGRVATEPAGQATVIRGRSSARCEGRVVCDGRAAAPRPRESRRGD